MNSGLAIVGLTLLLVAAVSRRLSSTPVTPAMVVTAVGVLVGPLVLNDLVCASHEFDGAEFGRGDARGGAVLGFLARGSAGAAARGFDAGTSAWRGSATDGRARRAGRGAPVWVVLAQRGVDPWGDPRADRRRAWQRGRHGRETSAGCASVAQRRERPQRRDLRSPAADRAGDRLRRRRRVPSAARGGRGDRLRTARRRRRGRPRRGGRERGRRTASD